jgi:hypothetical protein
MDSPEREEEVCKSQLRETLHTHMRLLHRQTFEVLARV